MVVSIMEKPEYRHPHQYYLFYWGPKMVLRILLGNPHHCKSPVPISRSIFFATWLSIVEVASLYNPYQVEWKDLKSWAWHHVKKSAASQTLGKRGKGRWGMGKKPQHNGVYNRGPLPHLPSSHFLIPLRSCCFLQAHLCINNGGSTTRTRNG